MTDSPPDLKAVLAQMAGADPDTEQANLAEDTLRRARWAKAHNDGHPNGAWSTGEQLAVALVLDDTEHLSAMDYTPAEAARRVTDGMFFPPVDVDAWFAGLRAQLAA
jgi:hypothetical protein